MDKFGIDEDADPGIIRINPFTIRPLPKFSMTKGDLIESIDGNHYFGYIFKERKGISALFFSSLTQENRVFHFKDEFLCSFAKRKDFFELQESWDLKRLIKIEIQKESHKKIDLVLMNKSLKTSDGIKVKKIQVVNNEEFVEHLRKQLDFCDFDLNIIVG